MSTGRGTGGGAMKLFVTPNSPYARIARIAATEAGLTERIEEIRVVNRSPDSPLLAYSPVCRVPTLVEGALVLGESRTICAYFDRVTGQARCFPEGRADDWQARALEGLVTGFLDGVAVWNRELRREPAARSAFLLEVELRRAERCLDRLEVLCPAAPAEWPWDFTRIALAATLGILDHGLPALDWRQGRPRLAAWFAAASARPAMRATAPERP
ncbi:MAG: glutathione S-transferase [Kiloniellales bacterium]|nr:glutathione S-transferase [Kiloniellales bacterium]